MKRIKINAETCAGCRQCEMVCSFYHTGKFSPSYARVTVHKDDRNGLDYPVICHQCSVCPPIEICPTNSITKTSMGWTRVDGQTCIGCGACVDACTFNVIKYTEKALICDLCEGEPECVKRCPTGALEYVEVLESTESHETAFIRLKEKWNLE